MCKIVGMTEKVNYITKDDITCGHSNHQQAESQRKHQFTVLLIITCGQSSHQQGESKPKHQFSVLLHSYGQTPFRVS